MSLNYDGILYVEPEFKIMTNGQKRNKFKRPTAPLSNLLNRIPNFHALTYQIISKVRRYILSCASVLCQAIFVLYHFSTALREQQTLIKVKATKNEHVNVLYNEHVPVLLLRVCIPQLNKGFH